MIGWTIWAKNIDKNVKKTQKRPPKSSKNKMFIFGYCSTFDDRLSDPSKKRQLKCKKWKRPPKSSKIKMLIFGLHSTSDDLPGWLKDSNPVYHASPTKEMKCSFLDYIQLLMTGRAGRWTRTPSATPLQPKRWNAHFWITFNFWWSAEGSEQKTSTEM